MGRARTLGGGLLVGAALAIVAAPAPAAPSPPRSLPPALPASRSAPVPGLPVLRRVRLEAGSQHVLVLHEVTLGRGDWRGGALHLFTAFGAPGAPRAFDAHLLPGFAPTGSTVMALSTERVPRRPAWAEPFLGPAIMSGAVVHVPSALFFAFTAATGDAVLQIRALHGAPAADGQGVRDVVVRLGVSPALPLTVERIEVAPAKGASPVRAVEARLCGPDADTHPLAVVVGSGPPEVSSDEVIAPSQAQRRGTDELCVRYTQASPGP